MGRVKAAAISVEEARGRILEGLAAVCPEILPVSESWGRILAAPVAARLTQPPADLSAMDGYALRAADAPAGATLEVVGEAPAGKPWPGRLGPGQALRLFTGSVIPVGADAVLLQEDARREGARLRVTESVSARQHIRRQGQDFTAGDIVLRPGHKLGARDLGLAAAANHPWLSVHRRPVVAILATGDEIGLPGEPIPPGGIVSSNGFLLSAMLRAAGATPKLLPVARDDASEIAKAVQGARAADLLITTGGASVGDHDLVQAGLKQAGFTLDFWKIAMRPGKPMMHGLLGALPVIGLPGNPVSAYVCAILFVLPAVARLAGDPRLLPAVETARAGAALRANDSRADHMRASLAFENGAWVATPFARQDSALLTILAAAEALILRPPHAAALEVGDPVQIIRLDGGV